MSPPDSIKELIAKVDAAVRDQGFASESDRIVIVVGPSMGVPGTANQVIIHTVGMETP
jgi:pyruvate kinase